MHNKKTTKFNDSGVLQSPVSYEVEIEILNNISSSTLTFLDGSVTIILFIFK